MRNGIWYLSKPLANQALNFKSFFSIIKSNPHFPGLHDGVGLRQSSPPQATHPDAHVLENSGHQLARRGPVPDVQGRGYEGQVAYDWGLHQGLSGEQTDDSGRGSFEPPLVRVEGKEQSLITTQDNYCPL